MLDRIDELVPPGSNVNVADTGWEPASLRRSQRRRPRRPGPGLSSRRAQAGDGLDRRDGRPEVARLARASTIPMKGPTTTETVNQREQEAGDQRHRLQDAQSGRSHQAQIRNGPGDQLCCRRWPAWPPSAQVTTQTTSCTNRQAR